MQYDEVAEYVERLVGKDGTALSYAYRKSLELQPYGVFPIDSSRGRFLELVTRMTNPKRVLEIGPGGGYSGLWFLEGMRAVSRLEVIEQDPYVAAEFAKVMKNAGFERKVTIHLGSALDVLPQLKGYYDCVFIDAAKDEYPDYLRHLMRLTRVGSVILADNLLWGGSVLTGRRRGGANGIREYTRMIFNDKRLRSLIVPLGDGLAVSYRVA